MKTEKIGINLSKIKQDCENVIKEINICIYNLPGEYKIIEDLLVESTKCLNEYIDTNNAMKIRESGDCLYGVISELKKIKEKNRKFEIHTISKSNLDIRSLVLLLGQVAFCFHPYIIHPFRLFESKRLMLRVQELVEK